MSTAASRLAALASDRQRGLTSPEAAARLARDGPNEIPEQPSHPIARLARKFWGLSAAMIELIALLSFLLHKRVDFFIAIGLLVVNAVLGFLQEQRASTALRALRHRLSISGRVLRDGVWQTVAARTLVRGDIVRIRSGDFVPADALVLEGTAQADQAALTGESRPVDKTTDDVLYSGSIIRLGELTAVVTATGTTTSFGRTAELVERAQPRLHVEEVVARVVKWLFLIVAVLVLLAIVMATAEGLPLVEILPLSLVLLMSAVPVALPVMFTVSMAVGSIELARRGVLVTRLSAAEDAAHMDILCADKTGTLTMNRLSMHDTAPQPGFTADDVLRDGAWASNEANQDPIDLAFIQAARTRGLPRPDRVLSFVPFSASTRRTEAVVQTDRGTTRVMKGALHTVAAIAGVDAAAVVRLEASASSEAQRGARVLAVARAAGNDQWQLVGLAFLRDPLRPDSRQLIEELNDLGVSVQMLTGDALSVARDVAHQLGLGDVVSASVLHSEQNGEQTLKIAGIEKPAGFAEIFPEDKFVVVKRLQAGGHVVGMTGDGVNDAPALRQAEVGIAVNGATDVAKGAASVVLTNDGLVNVVSLVTHGRAIYQRVLTWIVNKISRTILKAGFVVVAFLVTGRFVISALGMVLLVFMTDFVKISLATDRVHPSPRPETWDIAPLVRLAVVLGVLMLGEALGVLAFGWRQFNLGDGSSALQTFTFQTLLFFALFSIVSIRERRYFWASRPGRVLAWALAGDALVGLAIGHYGLGELPPLPAVQIAFVVGCALVCSLVVNDPIKVALARSSIRERRTGGAATSSDTSSRTPTGSD